MKVISSYQCSTCDYIYRNMEEALECQRQHVSPLTIISSEDLKDGTDEFPGTIFIEHRDNNEAVALYTFDGLMNKD